MTLRTLLAVLILLSVTALVLTLVLRLPDEEPDGILETLPAQVDLALESLHYTQTEGVQRSWTLDAESAALRRETGLVSLERVEMVFFAVTNYEEIRLRAAEGVFDQNREQVEIWGDVRIDTDQGESFRSERLRYDQSTRLLSSDGQVRISTPTLELTGTGFSLDLVSGRMVLLQDVMGRLRFPGGERAEQR